MKISNSRPWFGVSLLLLLIGSLLTSALFVSDCLAIQTEEVQAAEAAQGQDAPPATVATPDAKAAPAEEDELAEDSETTIEKAPQISDQFAQLHLRDGSIIGGEIETKTIDIKTNFGMLTVPIARIVRIYPGLNSSPELNLKITQLVEDLGNNEAATRDAAQKELVSMGVKIVNILRQSGDGGNAERKKRLAQIRSSLDELLADEFDGDPDAESLLTYDDRIVTPDFSITGKIQQQEFRVVSKFGDLVVKLDDLKLADRLSSDSKSEIRKTVSVPAMAFFQTQPKSTGIRVNKGDKISIGADGVVQWTNWNSSSTPAGLTNRSNWNGINSGTLVARIGTNNSNCVSVGTKGEFVAKLSGTLYLGISMRDSYASNASYKWAGAYKARIRVNPDAN
jgi:hypothetical protein